MNENIVARLRQLATAMMLGDFQGLAETAESAADEIERLRAERDEARREVCGLLVACHTDPDDDDKPDPNLKHIHAGIRGWDCYKNYINYKENTNG